MLVRNAVYQLCLPGAVILSLLGLVLPVVQIFIGAHHTSGFQFSYSMPYMIGFNNCFQSSAFESVVFAWGSQEKIIEALAVARVLIGLQIGMWLVLSMVYVRHFRVAHSIPKDFWWSMFVLMCILGFIVAPMLRQPQMTCEVVLLGRSLSMSYSASARLNHVTVLLSSLSIGLGVVAIFVYNRKKNL